MRFAALALSLLFAVTSAGQARVREEQFDLPVEVIDNYGKEIRQSIKVTVFFDDANRGPAPVLLINHGRASEAQERADLGRARYTETSRWFVQQGFVVAVPTRIGYGVSGGEDVEDSGSCTHKRYLAGYLAAARQSLAVLEAVRQRPDADKSRAVMLGQSYGGATSVTLASLNPPGVLAAINFAGGGGGNPKTSPRRPCAPQLLEQMFRDYGKAAKVPMLWVYTENDLYFGPKHPRDWFEAYVAGGAPAEFIQFPPHGDDGHSLFTRFPDAWKPKVIEFLRARGFAMPVEKDTPK